MLLHGRRGIVLVRPRSYARAERPTVKTLLRASLLVPLFVAACLPTVAQEAPEARPEPSLLRRYLDASGSERADLKKQLLALGAEGLQKQIAALEFRAPDKQGVVKLTTRCPDGFDRPFWVYVPEKYDHRKSYPLLVCMHGGVGGAPLDETEDTPAYGENSLKYFTEYWGEAWKSEVVLLGVSAGVPETHEDAMWWRNAGQQNVLHMVQQTRRLLNIDDDRIFATGHSDGGSGTFGFAARRPDAFAGFFPMCGHPLVPHSMGATVWLENLKGLPVYAFNGTDDRLYPAAQVTPVYDQANKLGAKIEYNAVAKLGHAVGPALPTEVPKFLDSYVAKVRRTLPNEVDWTTDSADTGRRAWIAVDALYDLGAHNAVAENAAIQTPGRRVRLGVQLSQEVEEPTVDSVVAGSNAEQMGIKEGDVILKLDDTKVASVDDLLAALGNKAPGDAVTIVVKRDGKEETLKGSFAKTEQRAETPSALAARVSAAMAPGKVTLRVRNAAKLTVWVLPEMLDAEGKLKVVLVDAKGTEHVLAEHKVIADPAVILEQFEQGYDRRRVFIGRIELDVAGKLGVKTVPQQEDDEF